MSIEKMLGWIILLLATLVFQKSVGEDSLLAMFIGVVVSFFGLLVGAFVVF